MPAPDPAPDGSSTTPRAAGANGDTLLRTLLRRLRRRLGMSANGDMSVLGALDELIEGRDDESSALRADERMLLANILRLRHRAAEDAMVPRADIVGIDATASLAEVTDLMTKTGHSRIPVFRDTLDDVLGMVHIKDVLAWRGNDELFNLSKVLRRVLFVAPSMEVLQLLLEMRAKRSHMALVVDEFGGIDGLVTIEDVVEEIVGEIADEHDKESEPTVTVLPDGSLDADARAPIELLDEHFATVLSEEEREDIDTVGGLVVTLAGRVPIRGELIGHPGGLEFEVLEADPRRIKRVRVRRCDVAASPPPAADAASAPPDMG
jgi:CBS domain containing-hemolysin-like protein